MRGCRARSFRFVGTETQATGNWIKALSLSILAAVPPSVDVSAQVSTQYPFCLQGDDYPSWSNCTLTSFQQCQASASGTHEECMANPWYKPEPTRRRHLRRDRRASMVRFRSDRLRDDQDPWSRPPDRANTPSQMAAPGVSLVERPGLAHRLNVNQSSSHLNVQVH